MFLGAGTFPSKGDGVTASLKILEPILTPKQSDLEARVTKFGGNTCKAGACFYSISNAPVPRGRPSVPPNFWDPTYAKTVRPTSSSVVFCCPAGF